MRTLVVVMIVAACGGAAPRPEPLQGRADATAPTTSATLDWPTLIGKPVAEAQTTIRQFLGVAPTTDLYTIGVEIQPSKQRVVETVFLHVMPETENGPVYTGPLFRGLQPTMKRAQIVNVLGAPHETGGPEADWIKYRLAEAQIHFEFRGAALYMVTLMDPAWEPGG
jgi:hypothetical protein